MKTFKDFLGESQTLKESTIKSDTDLIKDLQDFAINVSKVNKQLASKLEQSIEELERDTYDREVHRELLSLMRRAPSNRVNDRILDNVEDYLESL